jgi:hypothetical protein
MLPPRRSVERMRAPNRASTVRPGTPSGASGTPIRTVVSSISWVATIVRIS